MKRSGPVVVAFCVLLALPATAQVPDEFTNLKVLPKDIGKRELISTMRSFSGALGVRCKHCHVGPENLQGMDFATDELETKRVARTMLKMTGEINDELLPETGRESLLRVRCVTCHRGVARPERLGDILEATAEADGVDAALARYGELRDEYYGSGAYDFGTGTLNDFAETLARDKGDLDGALKVVQANLEAHPDDAYTHVMLGQVYMQQGDKAAAVAAMERAVELDPESDYYKKMLGRVKGAE